MNNPNTYQLLGDPERLFTQEGVTEKEGGTSPQLFLTEGHSELRVNSVLRLLPRLQLFSNIFHELVQIQVTGGSIIRRDTSSILGFRPLFPTKTGPTSSWWCQDFWH